MNTSSYLVPNYPMKEPLFYLPEVPKILKVPEPKQLKKPPAMGYDMKTSRKQIEFYQQEIDEHNQLQSSLYTQNEQLWNYLQELLESNKANIKIMKSQIMKLHDELKRVHREKQEVAEKLELTRNSKQMMIDLHNELKDVQFSVEEANRMKWLAEQSLISAKKENGLLEQSLQEQLDRMNEIHLQLDEMRLREKEDLDRDRADEFFFTNRAVLKAAYKRFRENMTRELRRGRIHSTLCKLYCQSLLLRCWQLWRSYLARRHLMHRNLTRCAQERLIRTWTKWKVYTALELLFSKSHRRRLLVRCLENWKGFVQERRFDLWAKEVTMSWRHFACVRKVFMEWKQSVVFLGWNSSEMMRKEQRLAVPFHLKKIFHSWRKQSDRSKAFHQTLEWVQVPRIRMRGVLLAWRDVGQAAWKNRARLIRRFFHQLHTRCGIRRERARRFKILMSQWVGRRKRNGFRRWRNKCLARHQPRNGFHLGSASLQLSKISLVNTMTSWNPWMLSHPMNTSSHLGLHLGSTPRHGPLPSLNQKLLTTTLSSWMRTAVYLKHQRLSVQMAKQFQGRRQVLTAFIWWNHLVKVFIRSKRLHRLTLLQHWFATWRSNVQARLRDKQREAIVNQWQRRSVRRGLQSVFRHWKARTQQHREWLRRSEFLRRNVVQHRTRFCFVQWRGEWIRRLVWKWKELGIECSRQQAMMELKEVQVREVTQDVNESLLVNQDLEERLLSLQELLAEKDNQVQVQMEWLAAKEEEKKGLERRLQELTTQLEDAKKDRLRLVPWEVSIQKEAEEADRAQKQREAIDQDLLNKLEAECDELRTEVQVARDQSMRTEAWSRRRIEEQEVLLHEMNEEVLELRTELERKRNEIELLSSREGRWMTELTEVRKKLVEVRQEGADLLKVNDQLIQEKESRLRYLRSNSNLKEARLVTLHEMESEKWQEVRREHEQSVLRSEWREMDEMWAIRSAIEDIQTSNTTAHTSLLSSSGATATGVPHPTVHGPAVSRHPPITPISTSLPSLNRSSHHNSRSSSPVSSSSRIITKPSPSTPPRNNQLWNQDLFAMRPSQSNQRMDRSSAMGLGSWVVHPAQVASQDNTVYEIQPRKKEVKSDPGAGYELQSVSEGQSSVHLKVFPSTVSSVKLSRELRGNRPKRGSSVKESSSRGVGQGGSNSSSSNSSGSSSNNSGSKNNSSEEGVTSRFSRTQTETLEEYDEDDSFSGLNLVVSSKHRGMSQSSMSLYELLGQSNEKRRPP